MKKAAKQQPPAPELSRQGNDVLAFIRGVKFKKKAFGGVDEADVWKKIEELNALYEKLLIAERAKNAKLSDHGDAKDE